MIAQAVGTGWQDRSSWGTPVAVTEKYRTGWRLLGSIPVGGRIVRLAPIHRRDECGGMLPEWPEDREYRVLLIYDSVMS